MIKHYITKYHDKTGYWACSWLQILNKPIKDKKTKTIIQEPEGDKE